MKAQLQDLYQTTIPTQNLPRFRTEDLHVALLDHLALPQLLYLLIKVTCVSHTDFQLSLNW